MKKRGMGTFVIVSIILGLIVVASMGSLLWQQKGFIAEKIFGKDILPGMTTEEKEFVPYEIESELGEVDKQVLNSMNALVCALNSVAIGELKPNDLSVCPRGLPSASTPARQETQESSSSLSPVGRAIRTVINKVTGAAVTEANTATYGDVKVTCKGASSKTIYLASKDGSKVTSWQDDFEYWTDARKHAIEQVTSAVVDCWEKNKGKATASYTKCSVLASFTLMPKDKGDYGSSIYIDKQDIVEQLDFGKSGFFDGTEWVKYGDDVVDILAHERRGTRIYIKSKILGGVASERATCRAEVGDTETDKVCAKPSRPAYEDAYCVYFDRGITSRDTILLTDCQRDLQAAETFSCSVDGFALPQDIGAEVLGIPIEAQAKSIIGATGDPDWLVAYEAFPIEATQFWRKSFLGEVFSLKAAGTVLASGTLNLVFSSGTSIAGKFIGRLGKAAPGKAVSKTVIKETGAVASSVGKELSEEMMEQGGRIIVNRMTENGAENMVRSLLVEESVQSLHGVGPKIANKITDTVFSVVGKASGESFEKVEKEVAEGVTEVVFREVKQVPEEFANRVMQREGYKIGEEAVRDVALQEYRETVVKQVLDEMDIGGQKGIKGLFSKELSKEAAEAVLKRQSAERFFATFIKETGEINEKLLEESLETGLKKVGLLSKISQRYSDSLLKKSASILDELLRGTVGGKKGAEATKEIGSAIYNKEFGVAMKGVPTFLGENMPLKFVGKKWLVTTPAGWAVASVGKTTVNLPFWVAKHRYPALVVLGAFMLMEDSANEMIRPVGGNAIALNRPTVYGPSQKFELHPDALKYFVRNNDKPESRLYLVSPCKTKLEIKKTKCECLSDPVMNKFNFGGTGLMDVKPNTIVPKEPEELRTLIKEDYRPFVKLSSAEFWNAPEMQREINKDLWWEAKVFIEAYAQAASLDKSEEDSVAFAKEALKQETIRVTGGWDEELDMLTEEGYTYLIKTYERTKSTEEAVLDLIVEFKTINLFSFWKNVVKKKGYGRTEGIEVTAGKAPVRTMDDTYRFFEPYEQYFDTSMAVKECGGRGITDYISDVLKHDATFYAELLGIRQQKLGENFYDYISYNVGCLEVYPSNIDYYCYDEYPAQAAAKATVQIAAIVMDVVIIATMPAASPAVFFLTGAAAGAADVVISATELWPLTTRMPWK